MRFLDLNRYSLLSFTATLVAFAYSSHKSLFHTPSSFLNLGLLKSLEPFLKDVVMPFGADSPFSSSSFSASSFDVDFSDFIISITSNTQSSSPDEYDNQESNHVKADIIPTGLKGMTTTVRPGLVDDDSNEHSRLLGGAAGVGFGFRPSVFQAMLAERYLKFRTPSPAVLLQLQVILSYLQNEKLCVLHMYDRALNFLLFKVVFVGAILEPRWEELLIWTAWFTILGFLRVFSMLCRDRFEYLTVSPNIPIRVHVKILTMLSMILVSNIIWFILCISVFRSMLLLLSFECFTLFLDTVQTLVKYVIHLGDLSRQGPCESRRMVQYYTEFTTDTLILVTTLGHYLHIMCLHGISFTLIDAVLFLNMRSVFNNLRKKLSSHQAYRQALKNMQALYPSATEKELADYSDDCAICRDSMTSAKVLPCGHIFHLFCIRSWLEHHSSCPTCRRSLLSKLDSGGQPSTTASGSSAELDRHSGASTTTEEPRAADRGRRESRRGSFTSTPSSLSGSTSASTGSSAIHNSFSGGHSTPSGTSASGPGGHHSSSGTSSNRSSTGHQLFAFNSEQQPWLTRLGFPRITVEVVDPIEDDDRDVEHTLQRQQAQHQHHHHHHHTHEDRTRQSRYARTASTHRYPSDGENSSDEEDEDLRRAIAESLAMSQTLQSQSTASLLSTTSTTKTPEVSPSPSRSSSTSFRDLSGTTAFLRGASRRNSIENASSWHDRTVVMQHQQQQHHQQPQSRHDREEEKFPGCDLKVD
ncbi:hypothetical protein BGZ83_008528 [Gryganskiella cystojenkinii]|nr:hypothetical protein BGZ83_008528 [Gryganskiella cystojenkinii]